MNQPKNFLAPFILRGVSLFINYLAMSPFSFLLIILVSCVAIIFINISSPFESYLAQSNSLNSVSASFDEQDVLRYFAIANAIVFIVKKVVFPDSDSTPRTQKRFFKDKKFILLTVLFGLAILSALSPIARPGARDILGVLFIFLIVGIVMGYMYHLLMVVVSKIDLVITKHAAF